MVSKPTRQGRVVPVIPIGILDLQMPFYEGVAAGFPSPADDYLEEQLNVGEYLVQNPSATFFVRVQGDSMIGASIHPEDILVVDRSLIPKHGDIVIAVLNMEFTVKKFYQRGRQIRLIPANPNYPAIQIQEGDEFLVWGVVAHVLHKTI